MLNTKKLLYILPDVAYIAELFPGKKEHSFSIQSFRQINGEFLNEDEFIPENVVKLFDKIDPEEYFLILPDYLFTNTIINVEESSESKVKEYLKETLLPDLEISDDTHEIKSFILTEFKGNSKVQLSAIEKSVLAPIRTSAKNSKVTIKDVASVSWTAKAVVSLEPSITVMQIGTQLYSALHYIGVDQAAISPVDDPEVIAETIKSLKGSEPTIQTVYLFVNEVVEEKLKENLSDTIPLQQLAKPDEGDVKMPSYIKLIIETGMKTLSIDDYRVPTFKLGEATSEEMKEYIKESVEELSESNDPELKNTDDLPKPVPATVDDSPLAPVSDQENKDSSLDEDEEADGEIETDDETKTDGEAEAVDEGTTDSEGEADDKTKVADEPEVDRKTEDTGEEKPDSAETMDKDTDEEPVKIAKEESLEEVGTKTILAEVQNEQDSGIASNKDLENNDDDEVDLSKFALSSKDKESTDSKEIGVNKNKSTIKNSSGVGNMLKMIFIALIVFVITIAIGVSVGFGLLSVADKKATNETPPIEEVKKPAEEASPAPEATEEATPEKSETETLKVEDMDILVVNATTRAGYAGIYKAKLDKAGFGTVSAGNASGTYDEGYYVLMKEKNTPLVSELSKATGLKLEWLEDIKPDKEDPRGEYTAIIILAKTE